MKTSELKGAALDWAVAKCEGVSFVWLETDFTPDGRTFQRGTAQAAGPHYSTDWAQGGPIIQQWAVSLCPHEYITGNTRWCATCTNEGECYEEFGPTPLIAAMRCYVASKLGDEVEVPDDIH